MELNDAIYSRRSVREYTSEPVDRVVLTRLLDAALQAPSAVNEQPWSFTVLGDAQMLARISAESKAHMLASPLMAAGGSHFHDRLSDVNFDIFYRAPVLIVISSTKPSPWAVEDCALAAQNLMLAACAEGLGSCWIGFAQEWLATALGKALLGLPEMYVPRAPIIIGHPKSHPPAVPRKTLEARWIGI